MPRIRDFVEKATFNAARVAGTVAGKADVAAHKIADSATIQSGAQTLVRVGEATAHAAARAAGEAVPLARKAASSASGVVKDAVGIAADQVRAQVSTKRPAAGARPHTVVNAKTGQTVTTEAYVRRPDGSRDYDAVYPKGAKGDFGPIGNKVVGMALIIAGVPMLVLPGPGAASIAAGLYYLSKESPISQQDSDA